MPAAIERFKEVNEMQDDLIKEEHSILVLHSLVLHQKVQDDCLVGLIVLEDYEENYVVHYLHIVILKKLIQQIGETIVHEDESARHNEVV